MRTQPGAARALFLSTISSTLMFAVWGLLAGLAPIMKDRYGLSATQVSLMVAIPVLLGAAGRLVMGLLADRYGGKPVLAGVLLAGAVPAFALSQSHRFSHLILWGLFLGVAGAAFPVGIAFTAPWFSKKQHGFALGVFGTGSIGQSLAVFGGPVLARRYGLAAPYLLFGTLAMLWGFVILAFAPERPQTPPRMRWRQALQPLRSEPLSWLFSLFSFLTFGGVVALGDYLPSLLKEGFHLTPADAGARTVGFILLATIACPAGGLLSDRMGADRVLAVVFTALVLLALGLTSTWMPAFTTAALGAALFLGLGNGAVFKLVPQYFPTQVGTVSGLVGAAGGLGGFFPPLVLRILKDQVGSYIPGFLLLSITALLCLSLNWRVLMIGKPVAALPA